MTRKTLRAVSDDERRREPMSLTEAIERGDKLDILFAQRRLIADSLSTAGDSVRPQLSNELTKLNALIEDEENRLEAEQPARQGGASDRADESFDASAI
jgi:hypothetical protein